jgi:hypothetical protein
MSSLQRRNRRGNKYVKEITVYCTFSEAFESGFPDPPFIKFLNNVTWRGECSIEVAKYGMHPWILPEITRGTCYYFNRGKS